METEDFGIDWTDARDMASARMRVGDMEVTAHCHIRRGGIYPNAESIGFQRNSGADDRPLIDFGAHLPAGGYRRLAAMLTALADAVDADAVARATVPLPLTEVTPTAEQPTTCLACTDNRHTDCALGYCACRCVTASHG